MAKAERQIEQRALTSIAPYEKNAKKHPDKQVAQIAASIKAFGFNQPIVVDDDGEKDDDVPEIPKVPRTKPGDLYELGNHRVLCGDSTKSYEMEWQAAAE